MEFFMNKKRYSSFITLRSTWSATLTRIFHFSRDMHRKNLSVCSSIRFDAVYIV